MWPESGVVRMFCAICAQLRGEVLRAELTLSEIDLGGNSFKHTMEMRRGRRIGSDQHIRLEIEMGAVEGIRLSSDKLDFEAQG